MLCPECGYPQYCPCDSCKKNGSRIPAGYKPWIWLQGTGTPADGNVIECAGCGLRAHADWWEGEAMRQYEGLKERFLAVATPKEWDCFLSTWAGIFERDGKTDYASDFPPCLVCKVFGSRPGKSRGCLECIPQTRYNREKEFYDGKFGCHLYDGYAKVDALIARLERLGIFDERDVTG